MGEGQQLDKLHVMFAQKVMFYYLKKNSTKISESDRGRLFEFPDQVFNRVSCNGYRTSIFMLHNQLQHCYHTTVSYRPCLDCGVVRNISVVIADKTVSSFEL